MKVSRYCVDKTYQFFVIEILRQVQMYVYIQKLA